jgi:hypothetical protein
MTSCYQKFYRHPYGNEHIPVSNLADSEYASNPLAYSTYNIVIQCLKGRTAKPE